MHNGIGKALLSLIYPIKYFKEPFLPYKSIDNTILLISTLPIPIGLSFLGNAFLLIHLLPKMKASCSIFIPCKEKKVKFFFFTIIFLVFF